MNAVKMPQAHGAGEAQSIMERLPQLGLREMQSLLHQTPPLPIVVRCALHKEMGQRLMAQQKAGR